MVHVTRANVEQFLDDGLLFAQMKNGRWWQVRRNGKTRTWKRDPDKFVIPIKAGMYAYGRIDEFCVGTFRHKDDVPAT